MAPSTTGVAPKQKSSQNEIVNVSIELQTLEWAIRCGSYVREGDISLTFQRDYVFASTTPTTEHPTPLQVCPLPCTAPIPCKTQNEEWLHGQTGGFSELTAFFLGGE